MINKSCLFVLLLCLRLSSSLHLQHQITTSYLDYLRSQHNLIRSQLNNLSNHLSTTSQQLQNALSTDEKIRILEDAILKQKSLVGKLSKNTEIGIDKKDWTCPSLQNTNKQQLLTLAKNISSSTNKLQTQFNTMTTPNAEQLKSNSQSASYYSSQIQNTLRANGNVGQVTPTTSTNVLADNLVTGGKSELQDTLKRKEDNSKYVQTCPLQSPYFDGSKCIECGQSTPFFNIHTKKCQSCTNFNELTLTCPSAASYNNFNQQQAASRLILSSDKSFEEIFQSGGNSHCPAQSPFLVGNRCINCESPTTLFNYTSKSCVSCPERTVYESSKKKCISGTKYVTNIAEGGDRIILPEGKTIDEVLQNQKSEGQNVNLENCPKESPFYNGKNCISCENNKYFDFENGFCAECPSGTRYNTQHHACVKSTLYSNINSPRWTSTNVERVKQKNKELQNDGNNVKCSFETPFFNGSKCISCPSDQIFSFDSLSCTKCTAGTKFNVNLHSCVNPLALYQTNPQTAPNLIFGGLSRSQWASKYAQTLQDSPSTADCPASKPYFDNITCINCSVQHPYFNLLEKRCQKCSSGTNYDSNISECLSDAGNIVNQKPNIQKMAASIFA